MIPDRNADVCHFFIENVLSVSKGGNVVVKKKQQDINDGYVRICSLTTVIQPKSGSREKPLDSVAERSTIRRVMPGKAVLT